VIKHNGRFEKDERLLHGHFHGAGDEVDCVSERQEAVLLLHPVQCGARAAFLSAGIKTPYEGKVPDKVATFYGMLANIDENVGQLLAKLKEWRIDTNTLVVLMNDNGGYAPACKIYNAG